MSNITLNINSCSTPIEYGLLYNHYAVNDIRNITSSGWKVPSMTDYLTLFETYMGLSFTLESGVYSADNAGALKSLNKWASPNTGATNTTKFSFIPSGYREVIVFDVLTYEGFLWTSDAYGIWMYYDSELLEYRLHNDGEVDDRVNGYSVRLIKESTTLSDGETGTYTGNDGRVYNTVCIGTQEWLVDNLTETRFRNDDIIPFHGEDNSDNFTAFEWYGLTTAGVCAYDNDLDNVEDGFSFPTT